MREGQASPTHSLPVYFLLRRCAISYRVTKKIVLQYSAGVLCWYSDP